MEKGKHLQHQPAWEDWAEEGIPESKDPLATSHMPLWGALLQPTKFARVFLFTRAKNRETTQMSINRGMDKQNVAYQ